MTGKPSRIVIPVWFGYAYAACVVVLMLCSILVYLLGRDTYKRLEPENLALVQNKKFINEEVILDGKHFNNCSFYAVTLRFKGDRDFKLENSTVGGPLRLSWDRPSDRTSARTMVEMLLQGKMITNGNITTAGEDLIILKQEGATP